MKKKTQELVNLLYPLLQVEGQWGCTTREVVAR